MTKFQLFLALLLMTTCFAIPTAQADAFFSPKAAEPERADLNFLKKFYNTANRWGLYRKVKKMDSSDYEKLLVLHEKYDLKNDYLRYTKNLIKKKPKPKERRQLNRNSYWQTELRSFLIKNQVIHYNPTTGARLDQTGFSFKF